MVKRTAQKLKKLSKCDEILSRIFVLPSKGW
jgi:hypothetical protein